ncbi:cytochrome P450 [Trametes meyenii]|nr:cytochrome P450 [Trametes meyenii]
MALQQILVYSFVVYIGWRLLRAVAFKSPLANIPGPTHPTSYIAGDMNKLFDRHESWSFQKELAGRYGRVCTIHGLFSAKWLYTYDPRALHSIFVKDQDVFEETETLLAGFMVYVGPGLLATLGDQHRKQRKMLNPLFSAKNLRDMTPLFHDVIHRLEDAIASRVADGALELDVLGWMGRTALELIGQGGLGYSFDPLTEDVADEFADAIKAYFPVQGRIGAVPRLSLPILMKIGTASFRRRVVELLPYDPSQRMKQISDALHSRSLQIVNERKLALQGGDEALKQQVGEGKDIMSVLLRANMAASEADRLSDEEVVAQVSTLVLAAMDTTSNALARTLHLLSLNPEIQQKLREEITQARDDGTGKLRDLDYDEVTELPYLDAVCREVLRLYPPVRLLMRSVLKDSVLPLSAPIRGVDGSLIESVPVRKGMRIVVDIGGSNCDKTLWGEDAEEWKPERWLKPLPRAVEDARIPGVYSHLMTFIGGSRSCIGFKFSQLEMKIVLAMLIPAFKFELSDKTIIWNVAGVVYPSVGKDSPKPEMPLKVTRLALP